jgi:tRNA(Ile)-lysidine synthase
MVDADREREAIEPGAIVGNGPVAVVRGDLCRGSLAVRNRRPGDRFRPVGLGGKKKLQDFFVDRKVARRERDAVPLVVDETDRIVWVAGYGIDEAFRVTDPAQHVLLLRLKALGGSA